MASRPTTPDDWMLQEGCSRHHQPARGTVLLPSIHKILEAFKEPGTFQQRKFGDLVFFMMKTGLPGPLDLDVVNCLFAQLRAKDLPSARELLTKSGILEAVDHPKAPHKLCLAALQKTWGGEYCVVLHVPAKSDRPATDASTDCSCWFYRRRGHCPHSYSIMQHLKLRTFAKALPEPEVASARMADVDDGSSHEANLAGHPAEPSANVPDTARSQHQPPQLRQHHLQIRTCKPWHDGNGCFRRKRRPSPFFQNDTKLQFRTLRAYPRILHYIH